MGLVKLTINPRSTTGKNANRRLRASGHIPAVLYGDGKETAMMMIDSEEFSKVMANQSRHSVIFVLSQEGTKEQPIALMREMQTNPVTDEILHVDLMEIPRGKPISVNIGIRIEGESAAVKRGDGSLSQIMDSIELMCLPHELPEYVTLDITGLEVNDKVYVKDLQVSIGDVVSDADSLVLMVKPPVIFVEEVEEVAEGEEGEEGEAEGEEGETEGAEGEGDKAEGKEAADATKGKGKGKGKGKDKD